MKNRKEIAEVLRDAREAQGLSCYAVAKKSGLSISQVTMLELGDKNYTIDILIKCITGLGMEIDLL